MIFREVNGIPHAFATFQESCLKDPMLFFGRVRVYQDIAVYGIYMHRGTGPLKPFNISFTPFHFISIAFLVISVASFGYSLRQESA